MQVRAALCVLMGSLGACKGVKQSTAEKQVPSVPAAASAAPVASAPPAPTALASSAPAAPAPLAEPTLAELFDGAPEPDLPITERKKSDYGGRGTTVGVPKGWKLDMPNVAILILASPDKNAMVFAHDEMGGVSTKTVKFWSNRAGFAHKADITWEEQLVDGKFGEKHGVVQVGVGKGTLAKKPATFWQIRFKQDVLIAAALTDDAPPELKRDLVNAVRAVRPLEKGPQPYSPF